MNSNRGQYASAPMNNLRKKKARPARPVYQEGPPDPGPSQRPPMKRYGWLAAIVTVVLPVLFLLALLISSNILRIVYLAVTAVALLLMWILRAFARGARSTLTVIYLSLAVVIGIALFMNIQSPEARSAMGNHASAESEEQATPGPVDTSVTPAPTQPEEEEAPAVSAAAKRLEEFFVSWSQNDIPAMLEVCSPAWVNQQQSPKTELWNRIQLQVPAEYTVENIDGSDANTSRTVTVKVRFIRQADHEEKVYRMNILMLRVNDQWYVDPQSLDGTPVDEASEIQGTTTDMPASTKAPPTATPDPADRGQLLYYNESGGKYYHTTPTCEAVAQEYWPLTGEFYYSDINSNTYKHLLRCPKCNAPERP